MSGRSKSISEIVVSLTARVRVVPRGRRWFENSDPLEFCFHADPLNLDNPLLRGQYRGALFKSIGFRARALLSC